MTVLKVILLLVNAQLTQLHENAQAKAPIPEKISLCELVRHPSNYNGKTLVFTATYAAGPEGSLFLDDACKKSSPEEDVIALATSNMTTYKLNSPLNKKLQQLTKKRIRVQMTAVGLFIDGKTRVFGHMNCCRFKIEVQQLLAVEALKAD